LLRKMWRVYVLGPCLRVSGSQYSEFRGEEKTQSIAVLSILNPDD
jgi:hypothetical protein